jgi:hypothetical protein
MRFLNGIRNCYANPRLFIGREKFPDDPPNRILKTEAANMPAGPPTKPQDLRAGGPRRKELQKTEHRGIGQPEMLVVLKSRSPGE